MPYDTYRLYQIERAKSPYEIQRADRQAALFSSAVSELFRAIAQARSAVPRIRLPGFLRHAPGRGWRVPMVVSGVQDEEARRSAGWCRECVRCAPADADQAAFGDRGYLAVIANEQDPGQDVDGLIGGGVGVQRWPAGRRGHGAGDHDGRASRRAGQDDF